MFKSIFQKLLAAFAFILFVGFSITGVMMYFFLTDYMLEEKDGLMQKSGVYVKRSFEKNVDNIDNPLFMSAFTDLLRIFENEQIYIWIIDINGQVRITKDLWVRQGIPLEILEKMRNEGGNYFLPDKRQYEKVMQATDATIREEGYFYGLFELTGMPWLTIQIPLIYNDKTIGAVYLNTPIPEVQRARAMVLKFFLLSTGISTIISIILVYFFSRKLSRPIKQITDVAWQIADGDFSKRINTISKDEIGDLADSFNRMVLELKNLEEMRRGFIANVSHELKTPMTSIKGFVEGILDGTIPAAKHEKYLSIVRDETTRLTRLVNDLLHLARMESGDVKLEYKNFEINELIRICIIKLEAMIIKKNIEIEANFCAEKTFVRADSDAVERVLLNLLHNAAKFTPEKGKIRISTEEQDNLIRISVEDNGVGISTDEINRIWERFYKADKSRGKDTSGTGLGLAIIKNLINELNQEIWVESSRDRGTKFTFTLSKALIH